jgi:hypothetical protein
MNAPYEKPILPLTLADLALLPRWVAWQTQEREPGGKPTKVPYAPGAARKAEANNPQTWGIRAAAETRAARLPKPFGDGGVGVELGDLGDGRCIGGVDLDTCREQDGTLAPSAVEVIKELNSCTEVSPSGTGVKTFFQLPAVDLPALRSAMGNPHGKMFKHSQCGAHPPAIELHIDNRYFAVTDLHLGGTPRELRQVSRDTLLWLIREAGPAFAGNRESYSKGTDQSRSARAFRIACRMRREGKGFDEMLAALRADPELASWLEEKGEANDGRELRRLWEKAAGAEDQAPDPEMLANPEMSVLRLHRRSPPALPLDVFGLQWRRWIEANASAVACPPDYVAAPLLAAASAAIGNARLARATPGWAEPPHLWCVSVGDSGSGQVARRGHADALRTAGG